MALIGEFFYVESNEWHAGFPEVRAVLVATPSPKLTLVDSCCRKFSLWRNTDDTLANVVRISRFHRSIKKHEGKNIEERLLLANLGKLFLLFFACVGKIGLDSSIPDLF